MISARGVTRVAIAVAVSYATAMAGPVGPSSEYYVVGSQKIFAIHGVVVERSWSITPSSMNLQFPIAVLSTVRTMGYMSGYTGAEYTLGGIPMGTTYPFAGSTSQLFTDGATDGTGIYSYEHWSASVYRFDLNWKNPICLFSLNDNSQGYRGTIAYDPSDESLWLAGWYSQGGSNLGSTVEHRSLNGSLISSFQIGHEWTSCLAFDPADGTLWLHNRGPFPGEDAGTLEQYSRTGQLLATVTYPELAGQNLIGGEFLVPEPATITLLAAGLGAVWMGKRRVTR